MDNNGNYSVSDIQIDIKNYSGAASTATGSPTKVTGASNSLEGSSGSNQTSPAGEDPSVATACSICCDKATGKHYGANSCDGCKGFFRRSVRKNHSYSCGFNRRCVIDKDKRNQCRYCRLRKCFRAGMKKAAVQNERDKISTRHASTDDHVQSNILSISTLQQAENRIKNMQHIPLLPTDKSCPFAVQRQAAIDDVCDSMKTQLLLLVDWAKSLQCFADMAVEEQIPLLCAHAGEMLILGVVWRSLICQCENNLILGNNCLISRESSELDIADVAGHILDNLFHPIQGMQLDETEYACLKAIVFFDPNAQNLSNSNRRLIRQCRHQVQLDLMNYMNDKLYATPGRFGELLLLLPDLRNVTQMMVQKVQLAKMMGFAKIDNLLSETLLASTECNSANFMSTSQGGGVQMPGQTHNYFPRSTGPDYSTCPGPSLNQGLSAVCPDDSQSPDFLDTDPMFICTLDNPLPSSQGQQGNEYCKLESSLFQASPVKPSIQFVANVSSQSSMTSSTDQPMIFQSFSVQQPQQKATD